MKVQIRIVSDEGKELDPALEFEMPAVPRPGDRVTISRPIQSGSTDFIVRRTHWHLDYPDSGPPHRADEHIVGTTSAVTVDCEFLVGPYSSEEHRDTAASGG
jgi:hypothetical protein